MKKRLVLALSSCMLLGAIAPIVSCGGEATEQKNPTIAIESPTKTTLLVGETLTLKAKIENATNQEVTWTTSNKDVLTVEENGLVKAIGKGKATITATLKEDETKSATIELTVEALIPVLTIENPAKTTLKVGESLTLTVKIENAKNNEVTWTTSNKDVLTVDANGVVKAIGKGVASITATLKEDEKISAKVELTVDLKDPTSITLNEVTNLNYIAGETIKLTHQVVPADANPLVKWTSSDEKVATVDDNGLVKFIGKGEVKITVTSAVLDNVKAEITFNSNYIVDDTMGAEDFDFTNLGSENPSFKTNKVNVNTSTVLQGVSGKHYVFEAKVKIGETDKNNTWSRVGLGHIPSNDKTKIHSTMFSPGPDHNAKKIVTMDIHNGNVQWGVVTDRSQVWGQNGLGALDSKEITLTSVRNGNDYFTLINGNLYWAERNYLDFAEIDTLPAFHASDCIAEFSDITKIIGKEAVEKYVKDTTVLNNTLYASDANNVKITNNGKDIKFINTDNGASNNAKDNAAKSIGNSFLLPGGKETVVEFDLVIDKIGANDAAPAFVFTIGRYDTDIPEARSYVITEDKAGFTGWNSNGDLNPGIGDGGKAYPSMLIEGETYHVKLTKVNCNPGTDTKLEINGLTHQHGWNDNYAGSHVGWFATRNMDATVTNITLTSK